MQTVLDHPHNDVVLSEPLGQQAAVIDFSVCYARELSSLVWFVMSLGADAHRAADVAQSAFAEAFVVWDRIQRPSAWLRRVAGRLYCRHLIPQETAVEEVPDRPGPLSAAAAALLGLAALFGSTAAVAAGMPSEGIHASAPAATPGEIPHE